MVIVYNKKLVSDADAPKTWKALADPKWKDKIAYAAADKSGSSYTILATLLTVFGENEAGWKVVEDIMTPRSCPVQPGAQGVADGEYQAGLTYEDAAMASGRRRARGSFTTGRDLGAAGLTPSSRGQAPRPPRCFDYAVSKVGLLAEKFSRDRPGRSESPKGFVPLGGSGGLRRNGPGRTARRSSSGRTSSSG
jgi:hypothetical protein